MLWPEYMKILLPPPVMTRICLFAVGLNNALLQITGTVNNSLFSKLHFTTPLAKVFIHIYSLARHTHKKC